ncbi:glycosyltransferase family 4 protein [Ornithinimicrobium faecis]|uniref:glycosyltransferase family 4 protein n=1 Tax=Ornithinimicrobium faecis TaxID=2934158 RepID=UPI002117A712|nr:glycosyltransferase family 4 protein [Ornithinimicrobium sp. HY1745]
MLPSESTPRVGYVLKVYPRFSETFVVTEILSREAAGEDLAIFALRPTTDARFHPEIAKVAAPVTHLPKPAKLSDAWAVLRQARAAVPELDDRLPGILPLLAQLEASEAVQGIHLALSATEQGITHLHAHFGSMAARVARVASAIADIPFSVTTHAKDLFHESVDHDLLLEVLSAADHVVAISEFNHRFLLARYPSLADKIVLIRNGLDLARFGYDDPEPLAGPLKVVAVGRLVEKKGFNHLIEAVRELAGTAGPAVQVRIAGDGEHRAALAAQVEAAGLSDTIELLGPRHQEEIRDLLRWADVMAAPCVVGADGNADGLPTVLLEAMAMGVPVIASDVTGIPEAVQDGRTGQLLSADQLAAGDVRELVDALVRVADPDYPRVAIARAARELIAAEFDTARQARRLADRQQGAALLAG